MPTDWSAREDTRMAEYRGEGPDDLPAEEVVYEAVACPVCDTVYWPDDGDTCLDCQDAYLDDLESRAAHFDQYNRQGGEDA